MNSYKWLPLLWSLLAFAVHLMIVARVLLRPHREPASRIAWVVVVMTFPFLGIIAYLLLGETSLGHKRVARMRRIISGLPDPGQLPGEITEAEAKNLPDHVHPLFQIGRSVNGFDPVGGNHAELMADSNAMIESLVADIDAATEHVHVCFYIWLTDNNGTKVIEALKRAAGRNVTCRAMADALGSRSLIDSPQWKEMAAAGVRLAVALPIGNPVVHAVFSRIDIRNHRKIVVIDNRITYCGSQNCADPEFRVKAKYAPWVDAVVRFEGPIARQKQYLFVSDWMEQVNEDLSELIVEPIETRQPGFVAQAIGTGPTVRYSAMPEVFESLMYSARKELVMTTPYYVPDEAMQAAICSSARRGVETTIIFPARNDSRIVEAASHSYYAELLDAGVKIYEYPGGLLHTKSLTLDGEVTLIGSANMDRRSFELNFENNILVYDRELTTAVRGRQASYLAKSSPVTREMVANWSMWRRLWNNTIAMFGPVL